jgi:RNA polymerase sigma factor (sigma-70 family)
MQKTRLEETVDREEVDGEVTAAAYAHFAPYVRRQLAELGIRAADLPDLCHEVFLIVHDKVDLVPEVDRVDLWLRAICRRVAAGYRRRAGIKNEILGRDLELENAPADYDGPEIGAGSERRQQLALVRRALNRLDDESRDLLALHDVGEMPLTDLARLVDHDRKTVRKRLVTARRRVSRLVCEVDPGEAPAGRMTPPDSPVMVSQAAKGRVQGCTAEEFAVLHVSEARKVGVLGNVAITAWARATPEALDHVVQTATASVELCGGEFAYLALMEPTLEPPTFEARRKIVEALEIVGPYIRAFAIVLMGGLSSISEPILNGLMLLARPRFPMRCFDGIGPAAAWLCGSYARGARGPLPAGELAAAAERLRALRPHSGDA